MDRVGLGKGCLELNGRNSHKREFGDELERTLKIGAVELRVGREFERGNDHENAVATEAVLCADKFNNCK